MIPTGIIVEIIIVGVAYLAFGTGATLFLAKPHKVPDPTPTLHFMDLPDGPEGRR